MTDPEFLDAFVALTLPRPLWTHEAHLRLAFLRLQAAGNDCTAALSVVRQQIQAYNAAHANPGGYHETITAAWLRVVAARAAGNPVQSFAEFQATHPDLFSPNYLLLNHYTRPVLFSPEARAAFVPPDGTPLP